MLDERAKPIGKEFYVMVFVEAADADTTCFVFVHSRPRGYSGF